MELLPLKILYYFNYMVSTRVAARHGTVRIVADGETIGTTQDGGLREICLMGFSGEAIKVVKMQALSVFLPKVRLIIQHLADMSLVPVLYCQSSSPPRKPSPGH